MEMIHIHNRDPSKKGGPIHPQHIHCVLECSGAALERLGGAQRPKWIALEISRVPGHMPWNSVHWFQGSQIVSSGPVAQQGLKASI